MSAVKIRELKEKRASVWAEMKEMLAAGDASDFDAEKRAKWDKADADIVKLGTDIDVEERALALDSKFASMDDEAKDLKRSDVPKLPDQYIAPGGDKGVYERAFAQYLRSGMADLEPELRHLMAKNAAELRAQGVTTGAAGGYTVPQGFWAKVTETMKAYGGIAQVAEIINTETGNPLPWATNDDTSNVGALLAENAQVTELALSFGQKTLGAYTYTSRLILASWQFLQDSGIDAEAFIAKKIGQRLGRIYNTHATTGTGSSQPQGLITGATTGKTTAGATAITYSEAIDLVHSVDPAYRANGKFMFNDLILAYLRKLLDSQNRPLWQPSLQVGVPDSLFGYQYVINQDMASTVATTNKTMAFGDFNAGYVLRQVNGGQLVRLEERYADYLQIGFFGFGRMDGLVQDASAFKIMVQA